jgi:hypothetical protein
MIFPKCAKAWTMQHSWVLFVVRDVSLSVAGKCPIQMWSNMFSRSTKVKTHVVTFHWPNGKDIMLGPLSYDV